MVSAGSYALAAIQLVVLVAALGFSAVRLRARLLPGWDGGAARLVEVLVAVALVTWICEALGTFGALYAGTVLAAAVILAAALWQWLPAGADERPAGPRLPPEDGWLVLAMTAVGAIVVFTWAVTAKHALDRGIFNFDSLWYHIPFSADIVQSHSTTGMHHVETVFTNWFYPQNSELLHAVGILLVGRDTLSLFLNLGWLAVGFLAAWCVGRPYNRGALAVVAAAVLYGCHTLVVREPGAAKNDVVAAALLLAGIAVLVQAWTRHGRADGVVVLSSAIPEKGQPQPALPKKGQPHAANPDKGRPHLPVGWGLAVAGLAVGLAAGTKVTALAPAAALSVAVIVLAPAGRRGAAALWWFLPALLGGGYWYLRNLVVAGNPVPEIEKLGPISLPHPERLQEGRPDFDIVHYATDTGVWREYFGPGLHDAFGALWPLVLLAALAAVLLAIFAGRDRLLRWLGGVALFGLLAYLFTPLGAAGAEGEPVGFAINVRFVIPALLLSLVLVPLPRFFDPKLRRYGLMALLVVVFLVTDRPDDALHDPARVFALLVVVLLVAVPAVLLLLRARGAASPLVLGGAATLALLLVILGYPAQRHYLEGRFANDGAPDTQIPGMDLDSAYRWARGVEDARIGLAGTTAGFAGYGFYGADLSNRVLYLGEPGPHGAFNALPSCAAFRAAVDDADLDYLVTAPFLNFLHPSDPVPSPEARWLRGTDAVQPILRSGPVTVWKLDGRLDPAACGPANAPLREIPQTPSS
ncbi:MAG TPA: hypothetical protein VEB65_04550 [Solirubrobacterales bacterium]|nr:hypothetical protein [Solirubrobacterales bacterium]